MKKILLIITGLTLIACNDGNKNHQTPVDFAANAEQLIINEFQPSTLSQEEHINEMAWFT